MDENVEFVYSKRYKLTDNYLGRVCEQIKEKYGIDVARIDENERGYIFVSKYDYTIGNLEYDPHVGKYKPFNYHVGVEERVREAAAEERKIARTKRLKLQKYQRIGAFLTIAGLATVVTVGSMFAIKGHEPKAPVAVEQHMTNITEADDIVLVSWAQYAMGKITDAANGSPHEYVSTQRENLYTSSFMPVMMNYYNYVDQLDSGLPQEIVGDLTKQYHDNFRRAVYSFNEAVVSSLFPDCSFESSPYADAVVLGINNSQLNSGTRNGEKIDDNGTVIIYNDDDYNLYIQASDVPNNEFSVGNLPAGSTIYNNEVYVSDDLLYNNDEDPNYGGK